MHEQKPHRQRGPLEFSIRGNVQWHTFTLALQSSFKPLLSYKQALKPLVMWPSLSSCAHWHLKQTNKKRDSACTATTTCKQLYTIATVSLHNRSPHTNFHVSVCIRNVTNTFELPPLCLQLWCTASRRLQWVKKERGQLFVLTTCLVLTMSLLCCAVHRASSSLCMPYFGLCGKLKGATHSIPKQASQKTRLCDEYSDKWKCTSIQIHDKEVLILFHEKYKIN